MDEAVLLLPPSEGKAAGGRGRYKPHSGVFRSLGGRRQEVIDALAEAPDPVHGVRGELLARALAVREQLVAGRAPVIPAWERYTGVVWQHLGASTLGDGPLDRVLVPSALLGLTAATDPVPDYRLKFGVSLAGPGRLAPWWRPSITAAIARFAKGAPIVDLLAAEHSAAIDWQVLGDAVCHVRFEQRGGAAVGHAAKAAKGLVARTMLLAGPGEAARFRWQGWQAHRLGNDLVVRLG